jgi:hypothetical protein
MAIGSDVLVFISATKALLQSLQERPLNEEERQEIACCLQELGELFPPDQKRNAA